MSTIEQTNNSNPLYEADKQQFEEFVNNKSSEKRTLDYAAFKRLVLTELKFEDRFNNENFTCCGFTRCEIEHMIEFPEKFGKKILKLSNLMYLKSGYYKRLIDYFSNQALCNYTVDNKILDIKALSLDNKTNSAIKKNYIKYAAQVDKFHLSNEINNIIKRMYKNDVVYAFVDETDAEVSYYYIDPAICTIHSLVNGNVYEFYINKNLVKKKIESFPPKLQEIINKSNDPLGRVFIPYENSLCIKYNNDLLYAFPPFLMMIADILLVDEYKDLAKAQSINEAYKILTMKIPTKDGEITLDDGLISMFTDVVLQTVQNNIGVITTPFDMKTEEFSSSNSDDRDTVSDAISWAFKNVGVSEALMSGASSGSELKLSITNDSGDIFRIYRMIEDWIILQMKLRNYIYPTYEFIYKIMDTTIFNISDIRDTELKMAQNGIVNKMRLCAVNGISPSVMLGNSVVENNLFVDVFDNWQPLKTSYTMTSDDSNTGRPASDDGDLSSSGETTRNNDTNNPDNRI